MKPDMVDSLPAFLDKLGLSEEPLGVFVTDEKPGEGKSPKPLDTPTRDREIKDEIDWPTIFGGFSCVIGNIWRARQKRTAAYFSAERFGCPGGAFWLGFVKPQTETIISYVSTGIPGFMDGEFYCDSPDNLRDLFNYVDPRPATGKYCVFKPLSQFTRKESPDLVVFFARPETMAGLHQLATFVTNDPEAVMSPWSAACGSLVAWPYHYLDRGMNKAVVGGWDPSARKFFKTDELSFTVPWGMFDQMLNRYEESFLATGTWATVQKKILRSKKAWNEVEKKD